MMQNFPIKDNATCVMNYNALKIHVENLSRVCSNDHIHAHKY